MNIENAIKKLDTTSMTRLLTRLYGIYGDIDEIIERHLEIEAIETGDTQSHSLADRFRVQIIRIANEDEFIDYHHGYQFAYRMETLLLDINTLLREQNLSEALLVTEEFLHLVDSVFERADDSNGDIGMVFRDAIGQWLEVATELRQNEEDHCNWVDKVLSFFDNNDYGCFDNIISNSHTLLTEEELRQLAWRFENQARKALDSEQNKKDYNFAAGHACIGLRSVAEALEDMELYEKSTLIGNPQPNSQQLASLVRFALKIDVLERAEYWLQQPQWQENQYTYNELNNKLLAQQGNIEQLKQNLLDALISQPSDFALSNYLEFADLQEQASIKKIMAMLAKGADNIQDSINMLFRVADYPLAADLIVRQQETHLSQIYYGTLVNWAEIFTANQHPLSAIVCYRALLTDLLDRGYSKAYHHGARYFHQLLALDKQLEDYQGLADAQAYIRQIQAKHWRKRSFWAEADYPNKPE